MDYIWDIIIKAKNEGYNLADIKFKFASRFSPYMELSNKEINFKDITGEVEINPYFRFFDIFKELFSVEYYDYKELRTVLFDIITHFLGQLDLKQGMDRKEYYKLFIYREIKDGYFGKEIKEGINLFSVKEKNILVQNIYRLYVTGNHIYFLKDTIKNIFKGSITYIKKEFKNEVLVYIKQPDSEVNVKKLDIIKKIFLPVNFYITTYWVYHFGIIDIEETMKIDSIAIYEGGWL